MSRPLTRRILSVVAIALLVVAGLVALAGASRSPITRARLERDLPHTFANLYVQQAALLGHRGITAASLQAKATCDKGGDKVPDHGPGSDWICQMSWSDPNVPLPDGSGKFELNVHSNGCYTAGGPSKYVGQLTITDTAGKDVDNPVFEFDGCLDPNGPNAPTGVVIGKPASSKLTPLQQAGQVAQLTLPSGVMAANADGTITPSLVCSPGKDGCAGTITARGGGRTVTADYIIGPDDHQPLKLALPPGTRGAVRLTAAPVIGSAPKPSSTFTLVGAPKR